MNKNQTAEAKIKKEVYGEIFRFSVNPTVLLNDNIFIEFEKESECGKVADALNSLHTEFGQT